MRVLRFTGGKTSWAPKSVAAAVGLMFIWLGTAACAPVSVAVLLDPPGDDHGPGSYRYPEHPAFTASSFDLRRLSLALDREYWEVEVAFGGRLAEALVFVWRDDRRRVFLQTVDLYFRTGAEGGHQESLPGRGVAFYPGEEWQRAVVLSPVPAALRRALASTSKLCQDVFVPLGVSATGRRLKARVPVAFLGQKAPEAVAVLVLGARFSGSFAMVDRVRGELAPEGLVMEVARSAGECRLDDPEGRGCSFSGCNPCGGHPRVIDLLAPPGRQEEFLNDYHPAEGRLARVPMMTIPGHSGSE